MSDTYKNHRHPPGWENEHDPRCQACAQSELAAMPGSVKVRRLEYAWLIERQNSIDIVRHTLRSASEPSLNYHEQIIGCLCAALSQND